MVESESTKTTDKEGPLHITSDATQVSVIDKAICSISNNLAPFLGK